MLLAVREGNAVVRFADPHAGRISVGSGFVSTNPESCIVTGFVRTKPDTDREAAKRSLLLGNLLFLKLTRLVRSWPFAETADDAVLTLAILSTLVILLRVSALPFSRFYFRGLVDEAAKPYIHHQADRHEDEPRGRTPVAHER
jgi:hypothetical protein